MNRQPGNPETALVGAVSVTVTTLSTSARRHNTVNPYIVVNNVPALLEFLTATFDGVLSEQIRQPDGQIAHTEVRIGDSVLMVGAPQVDAPMPMHAETRPGTFYVYVADVDATYRRAMTHGASSYQLPSNRYYGDRVAAVVDSTGNVWWIATKLVDFNDEQLQKRADQAWGEGNRD
ncbi:MAG TPA: VOC family protein [Steroidobacteraceae bacterium]|jgi:PhnB protein|nr:VOC family protein [Steroidobacteraceae bacterium]